MKRLFAVLLSALTICSAAACSSGNSGSTSSAPAEVSSENSSQSAETEEKDIQKAVEEIIDNYNFEGVLYAEKQGKVIAAAAKGNLENGDPLTVDTPMPIGSVSKQFCAAAVLKLQEEGKLSIDDDVQKYFPVYESAVGIKLRDLLSMRSGIPDFTEEIFEIASVDKTEEENTEILLKWLCEKPMNQKPDTFYEYSNSNFFLLGNIVEQITGMKYIDYLRENFFTPLGMKNTGNIAEMNSGAEWAKGVSFKQIDLQPGITKGAGDIISTGADMSLWLNGLSSGKIISAESFEEMITDRNHGEGYGYGIRTDFFWGVGHPGSIGTYVAIDSIDTESGITVFYSSSTLGAAKVTPFTSELVAVIE